MQKLWSATAVALMLVLAPPSCRKEKTEEVAEPSSFSFNVYPGARYQARLTELTKQAHNVEKPNEPAPPTAIYDVDAPIDAVAEFYAKAYGYGHVAPDATNNLSAAKPAAYYRTGDLHADVVAIQPVLQKMNLKVDVSKAQGKYRAAEIEGKPNRPRVTIQRPYFDVTTSQVVDRTIILMAP